MAKFLTKSFMTQSFCIPNPVLTEVNLPSQASKTFLITGGYAGVGQELTKILYSHGATVYVAGRNTEKAAESIEKIKSALPGAKGRLEFLFLDLNDLSTIKKSAEASFFKESKLHVLINNAGVMFPPAGTKTQQGHDMQFGTNCLGPFLFTQYLLPVLKETAATAAAGSVRVLWASSSAMQALSPDGGVVFDETGNIEIFPSQQVNYGQTKVGNYLMAISLQEEVKANGIISVSFNPGNLKTELQRHSGRIATKAGGIMLHPAIFGAYTELFAACSQDITLEKNVEYVIPWGRNGGAFVREDIIQAVRHQGLGDQFWQWCEAQTSNYG